MIAIALAGYLAIYSREPALPHGAQHPPNGWWGWFDQGEYYKEVVDLASFHLRSGYYWYGYPLLGALFYHLLPAHPFLIPDLVCFTVIVVSLLRSFRSFCGAIESGVLSLVVVFGTPLLVSGALAIPWTTIPVQAVFCHLVATCVFQEARFRRLAWSSVAVAYAFFCRPSDIVYLGVVYLVGVWSLKERRHQALCLAAVGGLCAAALGVIVGLNLHLYGTWRPPYLDLVKEAGFSWSNLGFKFYQTFLDGTVLSGNAALPPGAPLYSIVQRAPWMLLVLPGAIALGRRLRGRFAGLILGMVACVGFYLGFNPVASAAQLWTYWLVHYFIIVLPWVALMCYASLRLAPRMLSGRAWAAALAVPTVMLALVSVRGSGFAGAYFVSDRGRIWNDSAGHLTAAKATTAPDAYTLDLDFDRPQRAAALRLFTLGPIPRTLSLAGAERDVTVELDGHRLTTWHDYVVSENLASINVVFINRIGRVIPFRHLRVTLGSRPPYQIGECEFLRLAWDPGRSLRRLFGRVDPTTDEPGPSHPMRVLPGETLATVAGKPGQYLIEGGWAVPWRDYTWSDGRESHLRFEVANRDLPLRITLGGLTFVMQHSPIKYRGKQIGMLAGDYSHTLFKYAFDLNAPASPGDYQTIDLELDHPDARSPKSYGLNDEETLHAIALASATFESIPR